MHVIAILPVKSFDTAKSRLSAGLSPYARRALTEAMCSDVLVALRRSKTIDRVLVVTSDGPAQRLALSHGAEIVDDEGGGHSEAAALGIQHALLEDADRVLLVPGDCPALVPSEVDELIDAKYGDRSAVIIPDRHGSGTNALLLTPPTALTPSFGPGSRARHLELAAHQGTVAHVAEVPSLALDVDTPDDLAALNVRLATIRGGAAATRGMLNQLAHIQT